MNILPLMMNILPLLISSFPPPINPPAPDLHPIMLPSPWPPSSSVHPHAPISMPPIPIVPIPTIPICRCPSPCRSWVGPIRPTRRTPPGTTSTQRRELGLGLGLGLELGLGEDPTREARLKSASTGSRPHCHDLRGTCCAPLPCHASAEESCGHRSGACCTESMMA